MKKNFFQLSAIVCIVSCLSACGTTAALTQADLATPLTRGDARIVVTRDQSMMFFGAGAEVHVNNQPVETLGRGGSLVKDVKAGRNTVVSVEANSGGGRFVLSFDSKPGKTYKFIVSPRTDDAFKFKQADMLRVAAFGLVGVAINAEISENGGYFQVQLAKTQE